MIDYIVNVPSLIYLKAPVGTLNELYTRYPDGGEYGWFAFVFEKKTFYFWNVDTRNWELMQNGQEMHIHYHNGCEKTVKLQKKEDLGKASTWTVDGAIQIPYGIPITVYNDSDENNGIYFLPQDKDYTVIANWVNASGSSGISLLDLYKSRVFIINTGTFIPPTIASETDFQITPGSYGVTFSEYPIEGLEDLNFNLEVSYLSNGKDILHTLTNNEGREFTRALYKNGLTTYSSTSFIESGIVDLSELYGQRNVLISTSTFIPATATGYQITPGSYGVWFTSSPIPGLSETKFNLKVDAVSTKNTGATNSKEYLHTLETKLGRRFTRYLYKESDELGYKSTAFVEQGNIIVSSSIPIVEEGREWISKDTITKYTKLGKTFIEL